MTGDDSFERKITYDYIMIKLWLKYQDYVRANTKYLSDTVEKHHDVEARRSYYACLTKTITSNFHSRLNLSTTPKRTLMVSRSDRGWHFHEQECE